MFDNRKNNNDIEDIESRNKTLDISRSYIVQAPAGSGKTELLVNRILQLLIHVNKPEEILAITFTKKAAYEMHERLILKLSSEHNKSNFYLAQKVLEKSKQMNWDLINHPSRLMIKTFDSFSKNLLFKLPVSYGLNNFFQVTDHPEYYYNEAVVNVLNMVDIKKSVKNLLIHLDLDFKIFKNSIIFMLGNRDQWLPLINNCHNKNDMKKYFIKSIENDLLFIKDNMPLMNEKLIEAIRYASRNLESISGDDNILNVFLDWNGEFDITVDSLKIWKSFANLILTSSNKLRNIRGINKNLGFFGNSEHKSTFLKWLSNINSNSPWLNRLSIIRNISVIDFDLIKWNELKYQLDVLKISVMQLKHVFQKYGEVDFIEVSQSACIALNIYNSNINNNLQKEEINVSHILVDEFQDTSPNQFELLKMLISKWENNYQNTLFLVGDPNQSIYKFRNSDVSIFSHVIEKGIGEIFPEFLKLTVNFRSKPKLVDWINNLFERIITKNSDPALGQFPYIKSIPYSCDNNLENDVVKFYPIMTSDCDISNDSKAENKVINLIKDIINSNKKESVALLVRARSHVYSLIKKLDKENICYKAIDIVPLNKKAIISDLLQLIRAITHHGDRLAWLSILRSPFCGLNLKNLHHLFANNKFTIPSIIKSVVVKGDIFFRSQNHNNKKNLMHICDFNFDSKNCSCKDSGISFNLYLRLKHLYDAILDVQFSLSNTSFYCVLDHIWNKLGGKDLYPHDSYIDIQTFFDLIKNTCNDSDIDIDLIENQVKKLYVSSYTKYDNNQVCIDIMTIHKSKGLEFDNVIIYGLHKIPRSDREPLIRFDKSYDNNILLSSIKHSNETFSDPLSLYLKKRENVSNKYEIDRILYVACTRARNKLYFVGNVSFDDRGKKFKQPVANSLLYRLWDNILDYQVLDKEDKYIKNDDTEIQKLNFDISRLKISSIKNIINIQNIYTDYDYINISESYLNKQQINSENILFSELNQIYLIWLYRICQNPKIYSNLSSKQLYPILYKELLKTSISRIEIHNIVNILIKILLNTINNLHWQNLIKNKSIINFPVIDYKGSIHNIDMLIKKDNEFIIVKYITFENNLADNFIRNKYIKELSNNCLIINNLYTNNVKATIFIPFLKKWIDL